MKKILLSNIHLKDFGGSELVTLELAEYLSSKGHSVCVYSPQIGLPLMATTMGGFYTTNTIPKNLHEFDIIWSHHNLLLDKINTKNKLDHQLIIANHMSSYVREEYPDYQADMVDVILANSQETKEKLPRRHQEKTMLFPNPSPMLNVTAPIVENKQPMALCVSNHMPSALKAFLYNNQDKIRHMHIGRGGQFQRRLSPTDLKSIGCDFVICNGKTVQYALAANLPVFLYDHFGGCGWLNEANFDLASWYNFSGRGFEKQGIQMQLKANEVLNTMLDGVPKPILMTPDRKQRFILDYWIQTHAHIIGLSE